MYRTVACVVLNVVKNEPENLREESSILDRMASAAVEERPCVTPNCGGVAKLRCPNCVKLGGKLP